MSEETKKHLVPKLRFPEFRDEEQWEKKQLKNVCQMQAGKFISASEISENIKDGLYPCYGGNGLRGYTKLYTNLGTYSLIGRQGALCGNVTLVTGKFYATEHAVVVTPNYDVDTVWLFYVLTHLNLNQYATGQAQPGLSIENLERVNLNAPKKEKEQQKIARCLSSLDDLISAQSQKLESLKLHKKGLMQRLFPVEGEIAPKLRFREFEGTAEWGEKLIGEITQVTSGGTPDSTNEKYWNGDIPWMNSGELNNKRINSVSNRITSLGLAESSTKLIPQQCVLIGLAGQGKTRGTAAINYIELCTNQSIASIHPNNDIFISDFLYHRIDSMYDQLRALSTGEGGRGGLNLQIIKSIKILLPNLIEQQKISTCISSLDDLITAQSQKLEALRNHKKGLMQQLFPILSYVGNQPEIAKPVITKNEGRKISAIDFNDKEKRDLLGGYIISQADLKKHFGHIKFVKHMVTAEYFAETGTSTEYRQNDNGPYDKKFMQQWAYRLKQKEWFEEYKTLNGYSYRPLDKAGEIDELFAKVFPDKKKAVDFVIKLMNRTTPEQAEIIATVYAVWNDLLINKLEVSESEIKKYFFKWSRHKKSFSEKQVSDWYKWMLKENFTPKGTGRLIMNIF